MSKMLALPHLGAVVAAVGNNDLCVVFMYTLTHLECDFDRFLADANNLVNGAVRYYESKNGMRDQQAVAIVGWSRARSRAVGVYGERMKNGEPLKVREIEGTLVCPGWPKYTERKLDTDAAMIEAARDQVAHVNNVVPECPIGGSLLLAEVTSHGITMRNAGTI
jgi:hypothetical protein